MFVLTRQTLWNPAVLETRGLPKRILGRVMPIPRRGITAPVLARLIFEVQPLRYGVALAPFAVAMLVWPHLALPIAQAPLAMVLVLGVVEMRLLRLRPDRREAQVDEDEAARRLDRLAFRARALLRGIAARQGIEDGDLRLVIEQSDLVRIAPLTLVSVQTDRPAPRLLDLDDRDRAALFRGLFDAELTERDLHAVNLRQNSFLREVRIGARAVSGHARMAAWIDRKGGPTLAGAGAGR
ncbi:hypothetical protein E2L08_08505 [Palleronia sediminis]|uniref:Uncharacterized protein n=1 Tax=Palleronia sediminis TaxID=2547833 RepID=A0A4R6ADW3_9RHOB|nr:hypothetical protein [Palleronia sediminis]TDL79636.1 hypothetical protein E2L08_08505 [Palleronia sediminis]